MCSWDFFFKFCFVTSDFFFLKDVFLSLKSEIISNVKKKKVIIFEYYFGQYFFFFLLFKFGN